jgi:hypothetical protein
MHLSKRIIALVFLTIFLSLPAYSASVQFNQVIDLKKSMWGYVTIMYSADEALVKQKSYLIGNLPFNKEKIDEYFLAANIEMYKSSIGKNEKDASQLQVDVILKFKSLDDLNKIKALTGTKFSQYQSDTGLIVTNTITPAFVKTNDLSQIYSKVNSEEEIKSSNGKGNSKEVSFFRGKGYIEGTNDMYFAFTLAKSNISKGGENTAKNNSNQEKSDKDQKSCGLFGFELPIILLGGFVFSRFRRRSC